MAPDSDVLGGPEPEEQGAGVLGRSDLGADEDELGGADPGAAPDAVPPGGAMLKFTCGAFSAPALAWK